MNSTMSEEKSPAAADSALLARFVRERDEGAFGSLVGRYEMVVLGAALRRTGDVESARDVAQKVYVTLANKAGSLLGHGRLGGWMYRAASYEAARFMESEGRRREREKNWSKESEESRPGVDPGTWETLENALARMPAAKREVIVMHYFEDRGYSEMAGDLGLSEAATRKRMSRALEDLGRRLRRSGVATPAVQLLAGAVAVQAALTPTPSAAASALSAAGGASSPVSSAGWILSSLTSASALKTTAAVVVLSTIPLAWQWNEARAAAAELKSAREARLAAMPAVADSDGEERKMLIDDLNAADMRLAKAKADLAEARKELADKKAALEQIGAELVVSHGRPEDLAMRLVPVMKLLILGVEDGEASGFTKEQEAEVMKMMFEVIPDLQSVMELDENPKSKARFVAKLVAELAGVDESVRLELESALVPEMTKAKEKGLVFNERPENRSPKLAPWTKQYNAAVRKQMEAMAPLLPAKATESELWKVFSGDSDEGFDEGVSDIYFGIAEMTGYSRAGFKAEPQEESKKDEKEETP